jgi:SAM-dependent methyltransferase
MLAGVQLVENVRRCPQCGAYPDATDQYCIFCGQVLSTGEMFQHEQVKARDVYEPVEHPLYRPLEYARMPFLFTQGQAILTRSWIPTQDSPGVRQTYEAEVHVPAGMRAVMQDKVEVGTLPAGARIWDLDLATAAAPEERFDVLVTVMTLHHIHDLMPVLRGFAALLADDGHLCIVDLEEEDGSFHSSDPDFDGHHGLARADLTDQLEAAGFADVRFEHCHEVEKDGRTYPLFLATCHVGRP